MILWSKKANVRGYSFRCVREGTYVFHNNFWHLFKINTWHVYLRTLVWIFTVRSRLPPIREFPRFSFVKVTTQSKLYILKLNFESYMQLTDIIQPLSKSLQLCLWFDTKLKLICINVLIFRMASDSVVKYDRQRDSTRYLHIFLVKVYLAGKRIIEAVISLCCLNSIRNLQHHGCIENRRKIFLLCARIPWKRQGRLDFASFKMILCLWIDVISAFLIF